MSEEKLFDREFTNQGAAPGTFNADVERPSIYAIAFNSERLNEADSENLAAARSVAGKDQRLWIDIRGRPDAELIQSLEQSYGFHHLALADVANLGQRPKIEDYGDFLFCVLRMAVPCPQGFAWEQVSIFITPETVISIQERPGDCFDGVRGRLRAGRKNIRGGMGDYLGAMLIDAIVDGYFPLLEDCGERLESLENHVLKHPTQELLAEVYRTKRELMGYRRALWPLRDSLNRLLRDGHDLIHDNTIPYLRDTVDHLLQVVDVVEGFRELAASFVDVYLSSVSHRTNEVMRVLTIGATIFIPLTFVAGIYGMNFEVIPELKWKHGYLYFWSIVVMMLVAMLILFRWLGWLRKPDNLETRDE